jgi:hypothetical protein
MNGQRQVHPVCCVCHEPYTDPIVHPDCASLSDSVRDDLNGLEFLGKRVGNGSTSRGRKSANNRPNVPTRVASMPVLSIHEEETETSILKAFGDRSQRISRRQSVETKTHKLELRRRSSIGQTGDRQGRAHCQRRGSIQIDPSSQEVLLDGENIFRDYEVKPANSVFRWNLLWLILCLLAPYPLWLTFIPGGCSLAYEITILVYALLTVNFIYTTILCWKYMWRMMRAFNTPFWHELDPEVRWKLKHIVVMATYKEPVELLCETISSIANQTVASSIIMVVGMEEKTPDQEKTKRIIRERFQRKFCALIFTVHPYGVPGEIPGSCSNRNYGARAAVKYMISEKLLPVDPVTKELEMDFCTLTVCDADTTYYFRYFENLAW